MIGSSASKPSVSEAQLSLGAEDLHLWLCHRESMAGSDNFRREVLSRYSPVAPADWRFANGDHGKPVVIGSPRPLAFNFSDSRDWLAMAVSAGTPVGLDLEYCDSQRQVLKLARRCFSAAELAQLQACATGERVHSFYDYWTLKEAGIKARGGSLALELESTGFELCFPSPGAVTAGIGTITPLGSAGMADYYCLLNPVADYRMAVCCRSRGQFSPRLHQFELLPGGGARPVPPILRAVSVCGNIDPADVKESLS